MALIYGIGKGLFSLGLIWIIGIVLCLLLARIGKGTAVFGIALLLIVISIVMVFYPREQKDVKREVVDEEGLDTFYLPRVFYTCFIVAFTLLAFVAFFVDHVVMPNLAAGAKARKAYTF